MLHLFIVSFIFVQISHKKIITKKMYIISYTCLCKVVEEENTAFCFQGNGFPNGGVYFRSKKKYRLRPCLVSLLLFRQSLPKQRKRTIKKQAKALIFKRLQNGAFILRGLAPTSIKWVKGTIACQTLLFFKSLPALEMQTSRDRKQKC